VRTERAKGVEGLKSEKEWEKGDEGEKREKG
jgi:hypothetical protein